MRTRHLALALLLLAAACGTQSRPPSPLPPPAAQAPGLDPVAGKWLAGTEAALRSAPDASARVIGSLRPGQPLTVLGRVRKTDWIAVSHGGSTGYVRLHLLRLQDSVAPAAPAVKGASTVVPKPTDNSGPKVNAAPRRKIEAAPIAQ